MARIDSLIVAREIADDVLAGNADRHTRQELLAADDRLWCARCVRLTTTDLLRSSALSDAIRNDEDRS